MNNINNLPIGVFDSGFGGLSVLKEIIKILPNENIVYFGDNGRAPYGNKSSDTILRYVLSDINFLIQKNVKMIVIACNTASAYAYDIVKNIFKIPIIEVVIPASLIAIQNTKNNNVGVIATNATINSNVYKTTINGIDKNINVFGQACPLFVPLIEEGWVDKDITRETIKEYLKYFDDKDIDTLILGCTHYPLILKLISEYFNHAKGGQCNKIKIINSGEEIAKTVKEKLKEIIIENEKNNEPLYEFYTSDDVEKFKKLGKIFLGQEIENVKRIEI